MLKIGLYKRKCMTCGKIFEARKEYAYKIHKYGSTEDFHYFCCYSHMRQHQKATAKKPTAREQEVLSFLERGFGIKDTARKVGMSAQGVCFIRDKWYGKEF